MCSVGIAAGGQKNVQPAILLEDRGVNDCDLAQLERRLLWRLGSGPDQRSFQSSTLIVSYDILRWIVDSIRETYHEAGLRPMSAVAAA